MLRRRALRFAVAHVAKDQNKVFLATNAATTTELTGKQWHTQHRALDVRYVGILRTAPANISSSKARRIGFPDRRLRLRSHRRARDERKSQRPRAERCSVPSSIRSTPPGTSLRSYCSGARLQGRDHRFGQCRRRHHQRDQAGPRIRHHQRRSTAGGAMAIFLERRPLAQGSKPRKVSS